MKIGLIGHSGFVGENLKEKLKFTHFFNSKNINEMINLSFDELICCGLSAIKWQANKFPEKDLLNIKSLEQVLNTVKCNFFIHISTIDVYENPNVVNEGSQSNPEKNHAYGRHRYQFERFIQERFQNYLIIRLPALFGNKLKKNIIFDLLNIHGLDVINPNSSFQYYDLGHLSKHIQIIKQYSVNLINFATPPIYTKEILERYFPNLRVGERPAPETHYDMHTIYNDLFGGPAHYIMSKEQVFNDLEYFIKNYKVK